MVVSFYVYFVVRDISLFFEYYLCLWGFSVQFYVRFYLSYLMYDFFRENICFVVDKGLEKNFKKESERWSEQSLIFLLICYILVSYDLNKGGCFIFFLELLCVIFLILGYLLFILIDRNICG